MTTRTTPSPLSRWRTAARNSAISPVIVLTLGAGGFYVLASGVSRGRTDGIDTSILLAFRKARDLNDPIGPLWLEEAVRDITALGGLVVSAMAIVLMWAIDMLFRRPRAALYHLAAILAGLGATFWLKDLFDRPRPDLVPHHARILTNSFPSGHAATAAMAHLTIGAFIARNCARPRFKALALGSACALTFLVGVSRVYLGVHWPTDIVAGWTLGGSWALAAWMLEGSLRRSGFVEPVRGERRT